ncbi:MAG: hypothetical protein AAGG69_11820 [Pseudomonadota bacterium]
MKRATRKMLVITTAMTGLAVLSTSASAQIAGNEVVTALNAQLALGGASITGGNVATSGDSITITNATLTVSGEDEGVQISELKLEGIQETSGGGYTIATATVPPFEFSDSGTTATFGAVQITNYQIAAPDETDPILRSGLFDRFTMGPIAVNVGSQQAFSLAGMIMEIGDYTPGEVWTSSLVAQDFVVNAEAIDDAQTRAAIAAMGYDDLTGDISMNATWEGQSGALGIQDFVISVDDAASIGLDLALGGYTTDLVEAMQQINATTQDEQAASVAMLGLMQQLEIGGAAITITDASLTNKVLDFAGQQQGTNAEGMKAFAKGMLPLGLAQLNAPAFAAEATAAIGQFLDNPGKLVLEAKPSAAIPVMQLAGPVMSGNPAQLIEALSVTIRSE